MPYSIDWYIENEIIYIAYSGVMTPDEMIESLTTAKDFVTSSPRALVHNICDVGAVTQALSPKEVMNVVRQIETHPRSGWSINLREKSMLVKMGVMLGTSIFKLRSRTFDTLAEARAFLSEMDPTLNWERANHSLVAHL